MYLSLTIKAFIFFNYDSKFVIKINNLVTIFPENTIFGTFLRRFNLKIFFANYSSTNKTVELHIIRELSELFVPFLGTDYSLNSSLQEF